MIDKLDDLKRESGDLPCESPSTPTGENIAADKNETESSIEDLESRLHSDLDEEYYQSLIRGVRDDTDADSECDDSEEEFLDSDDDDLESVLFTEYFTKNPEAHSTFLDLPESKQQEMLDPIRSTVWRKYLDEQADLLPPATKKFVSDYVDALQNDSEKWMIFLSVPSEIKEDFVPAIMDHFDNAENARCDYDFDDDPIYEDFVLSCLLADD